MMNELKPYPAYKDSGVPWLGEMPEHWNIERAKRLFRKMDRAIQDSDDVVTCFRDGIVTLRKNRRVRGFTESIKEIGYQGIRRGDLVIHAMDAFAGAIGVSDSDGKGTPVYSVCEPAPGVDSHFYAYMIREMARSQWIQALAKGIRERSTDFRFTDFGIQQVPLPPLPEQAAIVSFIDHADRRISRFIRTKLKLIKLLEEQKQAIIHRAVTRGLDPNVRLKPSGVEWLGDVPEHWEVRKLRSLFKLHGSGTTPLGDDYYGGDVSWVMTGDLQDRVLSRTKRTVTDKALNEVSALRLYPAGSLLVAMYGATIGKTGILSMDACTNQACCVLAEPREDGNVVYFQAVVNIARPELVRQSYGGGQPNINADVVRSLRIPVPPKAEQDIIVEQLKVKGTFLDEAVAQTQREISLIREYRTRLIADVVTGKLDVREAADRLPVESDESELVDEVETLTEGNEEVVDDLEAMTEEVEA